MRKYFGKNITTTSVIIIIIIIINRYKYIICIYKLKRIDPQTNSV